MKTTLYDPQFEKDACGVGFVAHTENKASHQVLQLGIKALRRLAHRGAVSADGLSGDGAGILAQVPTKILCRDLDTAGLSIAENQYAVLMVFLPGQHFENRNRCEDVIALNLEKSGMKILMIRKVPVQATALGEIAASTCPVIRQYLVSRPAGLSDSEFEKRCYVVRRGIEKGVLAEGVDDFTICSFSQKTIVYKGLMTAPQLDRFYLDLKDPEFETSFCLFHQRYSTNTFPQWGLAQPYRMVAHNGEINTLHGNLNWMEARSSQIEHSIWKEDCKNIMPITQKVGSDSAIFDQVLEFLTLSGRTPTHTIHMMVPEAFERDSEMEEKLRAFYEYHATLMEPWDGPAAFVYTDGQTVGAKLDRNGLRPMRYWATKDGIVVVGSETGLIEVSDDKIYERGRLPPGGCLVVDLQARRLIRNKEIKDQLSDPPFYLNWDREAFTEAPAEKLFYHPLELDKEHLTRVQKTFGYGIEELERILTPMLWEGKEAVGSMGNDTPIAVLSEKPKLLYRYFKQRFAQVTNPPIDPLRESSVMSLRVFVGPRAHFLEEQPHHFIKFPSPILSHHQFEWLVENQSEKVEELSTLFSVGRGPKDLAPAVAHLCEKAEQAVRAGKTILILTDRKINPAWAPIPMLLATSAVHHHLMRQGLRMHVSLVCRSGEPRETHHFACLIGFGATLIYPYLAFQSVLQLAHQNTQDPPLKEEQALANFREAIEKGILKIMSKSGISPLRSYQGAQIFEVLGIDQKLIEQHFTGTPNRIQGMGLEEIAIDVLRFHREGFGEDAKLRRSGIYRFLKDGEFHAFNPPALKQLHKAVRTRDPDAFNQYTKLTEKNSPSNLRDLLTWRKAEKPLPLDEVEPADEIVKRFCTQAMSLGALSPEAHETLAVAMNRIGGKSNSGEGGETPKRFKPYTDSRTHGSVARWRPGSGDWGNSAIKQVASGRFGVTPEYLVSAKEIEIKMAQGSKPGEGGQIPGSKVTAEIAKLRGATAGVTLISPPPHHDIYSIEDLAQLISDLKSLSPEAKICVKLTSVVGVGTIAAGVAKGYADTIQVSGYDGGTGASPLTSIKDAGIPWELGLAEAQQVLVMNDLRGRVSLRVDGGLKTGRDVMVAALLGAEEFGFGTPALVAIGCVMVRKCHLNVCPVGIATQRADLRKKYPGTPEHVVAFMYFMAEQVRHYLAEMGYRSLNEIIGRTHLLMPHPSKRSPKTQNVDLSAILSDPDPLNLKKRSYCPSTVKFPTKRKLDEQIHSDFLCNADPTHPSEQSYKICNADRSIGARLSGYLAKHSEKFKTLDRISLSFRGIAGQSFGVFCHKKLSLKLTGEAQDYVGKGMAGGEIALSFPQQRPFLVPIMGNTCLYGATGGSLFAAGSAGERLGVRNSGATFVVEGCGDHGCEYMTGGTAIILGETGRNFGAGMSGGTAFVWDPKNLHSNRCNLSMIQCHRFLSRKDKTDLRRLLLKHLQKTGSSLANKILKDWNRCAKQFTKVVPKGVAQNVVRKVPVTSPHLPRMGIKSSSISHDL